MWEWWGGKGKTHRLTPPRYCRLTHPTPPTPARAVVSVTCLANGRADPFGLAVALGYTADGSPVPARPRGVPTPTPPGRTLAGSPARARATPASPAAAARAAEARRAAAAATAPSEAAPGGRAASPPSNTAVACVCGSRADAGPGAMLQCSTCGAWQHAACVGVPRGGGAPGYACPCCALASADAAFTPAPGVPPLALRLARARTPAHPPRGARHGDAAVAVEITFRVDPNTASELRAGRISLHAASLLLADPAGPRVHWPRHADVRINNLQVAPYSRQPASVVGAGGRDAPVDATRCVRPGLNRLHVGGFESPDRAFIAILHTVRQRSHAEMVAAMAPPESVERAVERVARAVRGSDATAADDDDDLLVSSAIVSLKCPLTGARLTTPTRVAGAGGLPCFDRDAFIALAARTRKSVCPLTLAPAPLASLTVDGYVSAVLAELKGEPDVGEVEVGPDARWRRTGRGESEPWRSVLEPGGGGGGGGAAAPPPSIVVKQEGGAVVVAASPVAVAAAPRRPPPPADTDAPIIILSDSDSEGGGGARPPPARRPRTAPAARAAPVPPPQRPSGIVIRLPQRAPPPSSQAAPAPPPPHRAEWSAFQAVAAAAAAASAERHLRGNPDAAQRLVRAGVLPPPPAQDEATRVLAARLADAATGRSGAGGG